jgi:hypothetical protein
MDIINDLKEMINQYKEAGEQLQRQLDEEIKKYKVIHKTQSEKDWFKKHGLMYDFYKITKVEVCEDERGQRVGKHSAKKERRVVTNITIEVTLNNTSPIHIKAIGVKRFKYFLSGEQVSRLPDVLQSLMDAVMKNFYEAEEIFTPIEYYEFE